MPKLLLHLEGAAVLVLSLYVYSQYQFNWVLFIALLFVPDLSMLGYLIDPVAGAMIYNAFHNYTIVIFTIAIGLLVPNPAVLSVAIIWLAHIGMDRLCGFGLKYSTGFKDTHLNRV